MCVCLCTQTCIKGTEFGSAYTFSLQLLTHTDNMKAYLLLLILLPLCMADFQIRCKGEDFLMVRDMVLQCSGKTKQVCYTRKTGEKGCAREEFCKRPGWTCCEKDLCNA
ncbi:uncharacterized protein wu:fj16a03 [Alosa sapidissima]|uniref:uncharacterized protein wu:fj16a03 n=1 Tax=Alosa sapidissima TaxID=34773 RepID=UPI001C097E0C|nr:uncharacterized protein wu:fj16a03 [Alosa sapidissima]